LNCITQLALLPEQINKIKSFLDQENKAIEQDMDSTEDSWLGADVENLKQLDILNHYLPSGLTQAVEQIINLKNQEEAITTVERQLAAAAPPKEKLADAVKYAQAELAQAKATYETGRRHCEEIAAAIEKIKGIIAVQRAKHRPKNDEHIIAASAKVQATLNLSERLTSAN